MQKHVIQITQCWSKRGALEPTWTSTVSKGGSQQFYPEHTETEVFMCSMIDFDWFYGIMALLLQWNCRVCGSREVQNEEKDTLGQKQPTNLKIIRFKMNNMSINRLTAIAMCSGGYKNLPPRRFIYVGIVWLNNGSNNTNTPTMAIHFPF